MTIDQEAIRKIGTRLNEISWWLKQPYPFGLVALAQGL